MEKSLVYGLKCSELSVNYDQESQSWKMYRQSLFEDYTELLEAFPKSAMTVNGTLYRLDNSEPPTFGNDGSLLPTPTTKANQLAPSMMKWKGSKNLAALIKKHTGKIGKLNPFLVEWMMGFPPDWTKID